MGLGIFVHRQDSIYDDSPAIQYQFPKQYLGRVQACVGEWIIYYEPTKVPESRGYFAVAKVWRVIPDAKAQGMYLALMEPQSYLEFPNPVPFRLTDGIVERGLLNRSDQISGRAQSAVRGVTPEDFVRIRDMGFGEPDELLPRTGSPLAFSDIQEPFGEQESRDRMSYLTTRTVRDKIFRRIVLDAYDRRCVITGLKLINGSGRAEAEAAHIKPVEANGPDSISNGIALSGTAHWMFDRGLISLTDELTILVSRQANDAEAVRTLINSSGQAILPRRQRDRPAPQFLKWHRDNCFKS